LTNEGVEYGSHGTIGSRSLIARLVPIGLAILALPACVSLAPAPSTPSIVDAMPAQFDHEGPSGATGEAYNPQAWWSAFEDPVLNELIDDALANNLDIAQSVARLEQVRSQARIARAAQFPNLEASVSASDSSSPLAGSAFGDLGGGAITRIENQTIAPSVSAAYELDLFARNRNDAGAARQDAIASAYDLQSVQLAAAADTISTYFEIVNTRRQIELTIWIASALNDRVESTEAQFQRGLTGSFELYQIRQQLRATQASLPQLESALADAENRLGVLVGAYPGALDETLSRPLTPRLVFEPVPAGLPAQLLEQRPDVAAAWTRLEAARLRIGARRAERYPQLSLSASFGAQGNTLSSGFDFAGNWTRSLAASIVAPIFNAGRISANIRAARAQYDENAAAYSAAVLGAFREVDSAFADYEAQRQRYLLITAQLDEARLSFDLQKRRYASGVGTYTAYLDALTTVYQVRSDLSASAQAMALARLTIHRALAGDWLSSSAGETETTSGTGETG